MSVTTDIKIRMARPEDAYAISALIYDSFVEEKHHYTEKVFAYSTPDPLIIQERIMNKTVWVADINNEIIATVSGVCQGYGFYIRSLAVDKNERRTGLAKALMRYMEKIALQNNCKHIHLTTTSFLAAALKLYESLGFYQYGEEDLHGTMLIKMKKNLPNQKFKI